jgi:hypothetical protein
MKSTGGNFCTECGAALSANSDISNDALDTSTSDALEAAANEARLGRQKQHAEFVTRVTQDKEADEAIDVGRLRALAKGAGDAVIAREATETQRQLVVTATRQVKEKRRPVSWTAVFVPAVVVLLAGGGISFAVANEEAARQSQIVDIQAASSKAAADAKAAKTLEQDSSNSAINGASAVDGLPSASTIPGALVAAFGAYCPNQTEPWPESLLKLTPGVTPQNNGYWEIIALAGDNFMILGFHVTPNAAGTAVTVQASTQKAQEALTYWQCASNMRVAMY